MNEQKQRPQETSIPTCTGLVIISMLGLVVALVFMRERVLENRANWRPPPVPVHYPDAAKSATSASATPNYESWKSEIRPADGGSWSRSPKELDRLYQQQQHWTRYPEDMPGGANYRAKEREQYEQTREKSRKAAGWYDSKP